MNKKHLSMRWRFTLIVGLFMLIIISIITVVSIYNAKHQFSVFTNSITPQKDINVYFENLMPSSEILTDSAEQNDAFFVQTPPLESLQVGDEIAIIVNDAEQNYIGIMLLFVSLFAIVCVVATYFLVGRMLQPLKDFEEKIDAISDPNFSGVLWSEGEIRKDEIGQLQRAFLAMYKRLEVVFEKQKQFSVNAAHELKTPITVMKTGIQIIDIEQETDIQEYRDTFCIIAKNIDRLSKIIDDLLCFSNNDELIFEKIDLNSLIRSIVQDITLTAELSNITVILDLESIFLFAHALLLHQALFNLIENAIKYNRADGKVWISTKQSKDEIEISICNTGIPIPEEKFDQIFEPFYQLDPSRSKKIDGYGLGLSITKDIIQKHSGHIVVSSNETSNSFLVILPTY